MGNSRNYAGDARYVKQLFAKKIATTAGINSYYAITKSKGRDIDYKKAADLCQLNRVDPRPFIDWACSEYYPSLPQTINHLLPLIEGYIAAGKPDIEYTKTSVLMENMLDRMARCEADEDPIKFLLNPLNEFSCVFVYAMANKLGLLHMLPSELVSCATQEVFLKPVYKTFFSDLLDSEIMNYEPKK
jgi:hypothetical protein